MYYPVTLFTEFIMPTDQKVTTFKFFLFILMNAMNEWFYTEHDKSTLGSVRKRSLYWPIWHLWRTDQSYINDITWWPGKVCKHAIKNPRLHDVNCTYLSMMQLRARLESFLFTGRILGRNPDKSLKSFLLAIHSHIYSFALRNFFSFKLTKPLTVSTVQLLYIANEKGG
jgi:hypothetical protein